MESNKEIIAARNLFVLYDELRYPLAFGVYEGNAKHVDRSFMMFMRGMYEMNKDGWCIPRSSLCCYDIGTCPINEADHTRFKADGQALVDFIYEKRLLKRYEFPYRTFHYLNGLTGSLKFQDLIEAQQGTHPRQKLLDTWLSDIISREQNTLTRPCMQAISCNRGVLFFDGSGFGQQHMLAYLQHIADNYFQYEHDNITFLNRYGVSANDTLQIIASRQNQMFSPWDNSFSDKKNLYVSDDLLQKHRCLEQHELKVCHNDFLEFIDRYSLNLSLQNRNIVRLLRIKEFGYEPKFQDETRYPFTWRKEFSSIDDLLREQALYDGSKYGAQMMERIRVEARNIAETLLETHYGLIADKTDLHNCFRTRERNNTTKASKGQLKQR